MNRALSLLALAATLFAQDPYRNSQYDSLHDTPTQRRIRAIRPFPVGVVYWQPVEHTRLEQVRAEFRRIREAGFTALKGVHLIGNIPEKDVYLAAIEEGLVPWWYGEGGWEWSDDLPAKLGIPAGLSLEEKLRHPAMVQHQMQRYRDRIANPPAIPPDPAPEGKFERGRGGFVLDDEKKALFARWLEREYLTPAKLREAWNFDAMRQETPLTSFRQAADIGASGIRSWEFRRYRDVLRFQADQRVSNVRRMVDHRRKYDPGFLYRDGGELAMFRNFALIGTDQELVASVMADAGSFYPSIHPQHHFGETNGEVLRPVYYQAQLVVDLFKGGWTGAWESTGMPSIFSGTHGVAASVGLMRTMLFSYLAAGIRGIGIWTWNPRDAGWEGGEYGLTDRQGKLTPWGEEAGRIAKAIQKHRFELWEARNEPVVGVLYSWENMATAARLSRGVYEVPRSAGFMIEPSQALIGVSRALQSHNIPFEYVTEKNLLAGLAPRYRVIYLPRQVTVTKAVAEKLVEFARNGGRVVADAPTPWWDEYGRVIQTGPGSWFETIFGATVRVYQHGHNEPERLGSLDITGTYAFLETTRARVAAAYESGRPAITESQIGKGSGAYIGFDASIECLRPGNTAMERLIVDAILGGSGRETRVPRPAWSGSGAVVYRRVAPGADHYWLVNDGPAIAQASIRAERAYSEIADVVTGESAGKGAEFRVTIPPRSARWIRAQR